MWDWGRKAQSSQPSPEASCGVAGGAAPTLQSFIKCPTPFQLGDSAGPVLVPALPAHPHITGQAAGTWDPQPLTPWAPCSSKTTPQHELGASPAGGGVYSRLMPGPAEHLEESQLEAVTCQHLLGAHLALLPREIPASLYPVFLSFWLNFCCFPHAVPSCCPAAAQGGSRSPLCTFQHCLPCPLAACP